MGIHSERTQKRPTVDGCRIQPVHLPLERILQINLQNGPFAFRRAFLSSLSPRCVHTKGKLLFWRECFIAALWPNIKSENRSILLKRCIASFLRLLRRPRHQQLQRLSMSSNQSIPVDCDFTVGWWVSRWIIDSVEIHYFRSCHWTTSKLSTKPHKHRYSQPNRGSSTLLHPEMSSQHMWKFTKQFWW